MDGLIILMMGDFESEVNRNLNLLRNHLLSTKGYGIREKKVINNQYFQFILSFISFSPSPRRLVVRLSSFQSLQTTTIAQKRVLLMVVEVE